MSSLIFYTDDEQIVVATDTLAVKSDGSSMMYCSKAIYLPHIRTIIAGTGMGIFSGDWAMEVNNKMVLSGILNLDFHTPSALREKWKQFQNDYNLPNSMTTTVYHFGISEEDNSIAAFAYRSANNFISEPLPRGFGLKPECSIPEGNNFIELIPQMMEEQRALQIKANPSERIYIGGEAIGMHLTKNGGCNIFPIFKFSDYENHLMEIITNHRLDTISQ